MRDSIVIVVVVIVLFISRSSPVTQLLPMLTPPTLPPCNPPCYIVKSYQSYVDIKFKMAAVQNTETIKGKIVFLLNSELDLTGPVAI